MSGRESSRNSSFGEELSSLLPKCHPQMRLPPYPPYSEGIQSFTHVEKVVRTGKATGPMGHQLSKKRFKE